MPFPILNQQQPPQEMAFLPVTLIDGYSLLLRSGYVLPCYSMLYKAVTLKGYVFIHSFGLS